MVFSDSIADMPLPFFKDHSRDLVRFVLFPLALKEIEA
jgi:hypothetical protein